MKIFLYLFIILLAMPSASFGDAVDDALPVGTPYQVKVSARNAINLGVNNNGVLEMTKAMIENRFNERQMIEANETLIEAKKEGLQVEPLISKLHEGIAKKVTPEKILQAMEKVRVRYEKANRIANEYTQNREQARIMTTNIADCMSAGMKDADMERIIKRLNERKQQKYDTDDLEKETLMMTRTMALERVRSRDVTSVVDSALKRGYSAKDMKKLGNLFMSTAGTTQSASDLARSYSNAINRGMSPDSIQNSVSGAGSIRGNMGGNMGGNLNNNAGVGGQHGVGRGGGRR